MKKFTLLKILTLALFVQTSLAQTLPVIKDELSKAHVFTKGDSLIVSTGEVERKWLWTGNGLVTLHLKDLTNGRIYANSQKKIKCDWNLQKGDSVPSVASLISLTAKVKDDNGFSNKYLEVVTHVKYESLKLEVQHVIWVYPGASGIRTQLKIKAMPGFQPECFPKPDTVKKYFGSTQPVPGARTEFLPLNLSVKNSRRYWGYYNDPGNRHDQSMDMLKEEVVKGYPVFQNEVIDWASGIGVEYGNEGVCIVKESHKCVNQQGHNTGSFYSDPGGLSVTGLGLLSDEIVADRFRECWANWTLVYAGGNDGMQLSIKRFDRARYPVFPERDALIINDTWGPANPGGAQFAKQNYLLKEIPELVDLGIEVLRIDDGWQIDPWKKSEVFRPSYPDGWTTISNACQKYGIKMGLWVAIQRAKQADLIKNLDEAKVVTWKVDFDHLNNRSAFENRFAGIRDIMKHSWMKTQFSFCPEYDDPRYGWYLGKEYGSIYFQNIQEALPEHLTMVPYHVLRQHWLMSKYFNGNKLQVLLQNPKRTNRERSDAYQHSHSYCFAMGLPFIPVFFQSAQFLDMEGRKELKQLIALYKEHRLRMFNCYSFPVGDIPSNDSWSGFQFIDEYMNNGYLLLFRELHNKEPRKEIALKFLTNKNIMITNLESRNTLEQKISENGSAIFSINEPASYLFLQYSVAREK
ncbi:MAG: hypothetical protein M0R21_12625 [Lentimicrobiaceae bacterium]|nr:hypothetical protein [Lentimicrobiaceae bacterium]